MTLTIPQFCSSLRLLLTFDLATPSFSQISSAWRGRSEMKSRAWI